MSAAPPSVATDPSRPAGSRVVPGDRIGRLGPLSNTHTFKNAHVRGPYLRSSLAGWISPDGPQGGVVPAKKFISMPALGDAVLGRVTRVSHSSVASVSVRIIAVVRGCGRDAKADPLGETCAGIIRRDDIDTFKIPDAPGTASSPGNPPPPAPSQGSEFKVHVRHFRPGDVVIARVIQSADSGSAGDRILLSTAEDALGVLKASCAYSGRDMVRVTDGRTKSGEFICASTGRREKRKVADTLASL